MYPAGLSAVSNYLQLGDPAGSIYEFFPSCTWIEGVVSKSDIQSAQVSIYPLALRHNTAAGRAAVALIQGARVARRFTHPGC